jgi:hypothetical protein
MEPLENDTIAIPIEHQELVIARIEEARLNPEIMLDWDQVSKELES